MSEAITYEERRRELANRVSNGIEVTLITPIYAGGSSSSTLIVTSGKATRLKLCPAL